MHRTHIVDSLEVYSDTWITGGITYPGFDPSEEQAGLEKVLDFIKSDERCFDSDNYSPGHLTGSAMVVSKNLKFVLLTLHEALNRWIQLGGHADGHPLLHEVASREAFEESGLKGLEFIKCETLLPGLGLRTDLTLPYDIDIHEIPPIKHRPSHLHYDVRYLLFTESMDKPVVSDESKDVRWFTIDEARSVVNERCMFRQLDKVEYLGGNL